MNRRFALAWLDLAEDYRRLWASYCDLSRAYPLLLAQLREEREAWAASEIEKRFGEEKAA